MRLSYSAISTYQKCPLSYKFLYIDRLPTKPSHYLSFGNSIHSTLEYFYSTGPAPVSLDRLIKELDRRWLSEGYENEQLEVEYKEKGRFILRQYYNDNIKTFTLPLAVEKRFSFDVEGVTISGIIDRVDRLTNGDLEIIDYKTNAKLPPRTKITTDLQLPIYHIAAMEIFGVAPKKVTFYFLVPNKKMSTQKNKADIDKTKKTIIEIADSIGKQKFNPFRNPLCAWCDFIEFCPLHKNDPVMLARAAANGKISDNRTRRSTVDIERTVDEYLDLVRLIEKSRERLDDLNRIIHDHCETNSVGSVCGLHGTLRRGMRRTTHYDVGKLRELLEPKGLWEKVIDVNNLYLKNLLDNETKEGELAELIKTAKELEEVSHYLYIKDALNESS